MYREMTGSDLVFMAVIADLADSNTVGETKADLDELYRSEGSKASRQTVPITHSTGRLTRVAHKPTVVIEQAINSYSFRSSELSQPI